MLLSSAFKCKAPKSLINTDHALQTHFNLNRGKEDGRGKDEERGSLLGWGVKNLKKKKEILFKK